MSDDDETVADIERTLAAAAEAAGGTVQPYPRAGRATRRVVLRDVHGSGGSQFEEAVLEDDGTVRVTGVDEGPGVSGFFGASISNYDWVYVVPPDRVPVLIAQLGGKADSDVLDLIAEFFAKAGSSQLGELLRASPVSARFDNWMS
jgi:hypothetical protein